MPDIKYQISVGEARWKKALPEYKKIIDKSIAEIPGEGEVSILLTNDFEIQNLNRNFRQKDKPTNVLSFPQDEVGMLGDVALSLETLEREAAEQDKTLHEHFTHLFVHGVLHLMGHDHEIGDKEQAEMEALEIRILKRLGIANPY